MNDPNAVRLLEIGRTHNGCEPRITYYSGLEASGNFQLSDITDEDIEWLLRVTIQTSMRNVLNAEKERRNPKLPKIHKPK